MGLEWGYDATTLETVYQFSADIPIWLSQALASLTWDNMVYTIGELQTVRQGIYDKLNAYNIDSSAVTSDEIDSFITEAVDQVLFGECAH